MKLLAIFIFLLICFTPKYESTKIKRFQVKSRLITMMQKIFGMLLGYGVTVDECIPKDWDGADNKHPDHVEVVSFYKSDPMFLRVKILLKNTVAFVCKSKTFLNESLRYYAKNYKLTLRRRFQEKAEVEDKTWSFNNWIKENPKPLEQNVINITKGKIKIPSESMDGTDNTKKAVTKTTKKTLNKIFKPIMDIYQDELKTRLMKFFASQAFNKIKGALLCARKKEGQFKSERLTKLFQMIDRLIDGEPLLWIEVFYKSLCNWFEVATAIQYLVEAVLRNGEERWSYIGKFIGKLLKTFSDVDIISEAKIA